MPTVSANHSYIINIDFQCPTKFRVHPGNSPHCSLTTSGGSTSRQLDCVAFVLNMWIGKAAVQEHSNHLLLFNY